MGALSLVTDGSRSAPSMTARSSSPVPSKGPVEVTLDALEGVIEAFPPAAFNKMASTLCWEPRSSGAQILTIIATNGGGEKDTLSVTTYVSMRPMVESITPAEVARGQAVELNMSVRHDVYETLQPTYPPNLVTPGTQMYRSLPQGIFRFSFTVSPSADTGQYGIGVKVPGIMNGSNTVPISRHGQAVIRPPRMSTAAAPEANSKAMNTPLPSQ